MSAKDSRTFQGRCSQFRWLAVFMVVAVGAVVAITPLVLPRGYKLHGVIANLPALCYLYGVWSIGAALGEIAKGRLVQAALPSVLRRVGISLGVGGVLGVFVVAGLTRLAGGQTVGYVRFYVAGMTLGMIGGALFLLGRIMDRALAAQAELDEMI
jgi:hypothetical protein